MVLFGWVFWCFEFVKTNHHLFCVWGAAQPSQILKKILNLLKATFFSESKKKQNKKRTKR